MNVLFIDPGRLTSELILERMKPLADTMGGFTQTWEEVLFLWGRIEPVSTAVKQFGTQPDPQITHRILMRFCDELQSAMRLRKGGRIFKIHTVHDPDESRRYLLCLVSEEGR